MEFKIYFFVSLFIFVNGYGLSNKNNNNGRHRRRPQIDQSAYYDQSAYATTGLWPDNRNLITSASHTQVYQMDEGDVAHSNFVMTVTPTKKVSRQKSDINLSDGLDNAKTAEEYVTKAVKLHNQYEGGRKRIPTSSFTKYNYIEHPSPIDKEPTMEQHHQATRHNNYLSEPEKFTQEETSYYPPKTTPQPQHHHHQDHHHNKYMKAAPEPQNNHFHQSMPVKHHIIKIIEDIPQPQPTQSRVIAGMDKAELMSHIEQSVMKMFHEMERQKKREEEKSYHKVFHHATTTRPPSSTEPSPQIHQQIHHNVQHHTIKVAAKQPVDIQPAQYSADIIVRDHRNRPRPTDVSTTDTSNPYNYNHNSNFDHNGILKTAQGFDSANIMHSKPVNKLHFNQQTYHDINALPYAAEKDVHELSSGYYKKGYSYDGHGHHETSGTATSVGATISFGAPINNNNNNKNNQKQQHESSDDQGYTTTAPIHIINGIPVTNPYKMDLNAIRYMLGGLSQAQVYESDQKHSTNDNEDNYQGSPSSKSTKYQHHDSYSPKYNNNPKGVGYQDEPPRTSRKQKHGNHDFHKNDGSTFRYQPTTQHWNQQHDYDENDEGWQGSSGTHNTGDQYGSSTKTFQNHQSASSRKAKTSSKFSKNSSNLKSNSSSSHNNNSSSSSSNSSSSSSSSNSSSHNNKNSNYRTNKKGRDVDVEMRPPPKYIKF